MRARASASTLLRSSAVTPPIELGDHGAVGRDQVRLGEPETPRQRVRRLVEDDGPIAAVLGEEASDTTGPSSRRRPRRPGRRRRPRDVLETDESGCSLMHGTHHVAKKFTSTTRHGASAMSTRRRRRLAGHRRRLATDSGERLASRAGLVGERRRRDQHGEQDGQPATIHGRPGAIDRHRGWRRRPRRRVDGFARGRPRRSAAPRRGRRAAAAGRGRRRAPCRCAMTPAPIHSHDRAAGRSRGSRPGAGVSGSTSSEVDVLGEPDVHRGRPDGGCRSGTVDRRRGTRRRRRPAPARRSTVLSGSGVLDALVLERVASDGGDRSVARAAARSRTKYDCDDANATATMITPRWTIMPPLVRPTSPRQPWRRVAEDELAQRGAAGEAAEAEGEQRREPASAER